MNREIKFRCFDGEKMYEPFDMADTLTKNWMPWEPFSPKNVFMQYTGLRDKAGNEVFEGDILKGSETYENSDEYPLMRVYWNDTTAAFEAIQINGGKYTVPISWLREAGTIGNIYENTDLLK